MPNTVSFNTFKSTITEKGKETYLPRLRFGLLYYLYLNKDKVVTMEELVRELGSSGNTQSIRVLKCHIEKEYKIYHIETVHGQGYRWKD